jgi:DNA-binding LytR/AlgR family response regulator
MSEILRCIITDDEPLARKGMKIFADKVPFLEVIALCGTAMDTANALKESEPDFIFLDIQMPQLSGIEFLKTLKKVPLTVITSAYPDYALEGYELNVIDYLVKPVSFERFLKAVNKVADFTSTRKNSQNGNSTAENFFFVKCDHRYEKVLYDEIVYIEAMQNYVIIHTPVKKLITYLTMKGIQQYLPKNKFLKINKSNIIPLEKIVSISGDEIRVDDHKFTVGRNYKSELQQLIGNNLFKRS